MTFEPSDLESLKNLVTKHQDYTGQLVDINRFFEQIMDNDNPVEIELKIESDNRGDSYPPVETTSFMSYFNEQMLRSHGMGISLGGEIKSKKSHSVKTTISNAAAILAILRTDINLKLLEIENTIHEGSFLKPQKPSA